MWSIFRRNTTLFVVVFFFLSILLFELKRHTSLNFTSLSQRFEVYLLYRSFSLWELSQCSMVMVVAAVFTITWQSTLMHTRTITFTFHIPSTRIPKQMSSDSSMRVQFTPNVYQVDAVPLPIATTATNFQIKKKIREPKPSGIVCYFIRVSIAFVYANSSIECHCLLLPFLRPTTNRIRPNNERKMCYDLINEVYSYSKCTFSTCLWKKKKQDTLEFFFLCYSIQMKRISFDKIFSFPQLNLIP